jgi:predicted nucleic acid-binding protein
MAVRVLLDVNVLVSFVHALHANRTTAASYRTVTLVAAGEIGGVPVQMVASHAMLDALQRVLVRIGAKAETASAFASALAGMMRNGPERLDPHLVLGGTPVPSLRDVEDGAVLATAFAARATLAVTDNLKDFGSPAIATVDTTLVRTAHGMRQLSAQIHRRPDGGEMTVCHPVDFLLAIDKGYFLTPEALKGHPTPFRLMRSVTTS